MLGAWILTIVGTIAGVVAATYMPDLWIFVIVGAPLVWLLLLTKLIYRRLSVRYRLTTQRFIHETGILRRVTHRMDVIDMDDITFEQSLWERLTGTGTIRIIATDRTDPLMHLEGIASVKEVAKQIDDARRQERRRRGLHIETI